MTKKEYSPPKRSSPVGKKIKEVAKLAALPVGGALAYAAFKKYTTVSPTKTVFLSDLIQFIKDPKNPASRNFFKSAKANATAGSLRELAGVLANMIVAAGPVIAPLAALKFVRSDAARVKAKNDLRLAQIRSNSASKYNFNRYRYNQSTNTNNATEEEDTGF